VTQYRDTVERARYWGRFVQFVILTWNIDANPALVRNQTPTFSARVELLVSLIDRLVHQFPAAIVCIQEIPPNFEAVVSSVSQGRLQLVARAGHHVAILVTAGIAVLSSQAINVRIDAGSNRIVWCSLGGLLPSPVNVYGVHLHDRINYTEADGRQEIFLQLSRAIRDHWPAAEAAIIAGDFNSNPYHIEIGSRRKFWAVRDSAEFNRHHVFDSKPPFFNPMWRFLPGGGTYFYDDDTQTACRWHLLDQILISSNISGSLTGVEILSQIDQTPLIDADGQPNDETFSDHLPVLARIG